MSPVRAAVFEAPRRVQIVEIPAPEPHEGQVRIRLQGCGVCASNIPPYEGRDWFEYPLAPGTPGHEAWGIVDAIGPGVEDLQEGQRVAFLSERAYATQDVAEVRACVRLPAELDDQPFPGEPLACAFNVHRRAAIKPGQVVAIIGIGFMGAVLTRLARLAGARVIAISRRDSSLQAAKNMGAHETVVMDDHARIIERVREITNGDLCDCVLECVGAQWPLDLATELLRIRGRLVVAGYHQDGVRQVNMQRWNWNGLDVINAHEREVSEYVLGLREAIEAVRAGRLDPRPLYTHTYRLDDLAEALETASRRPEGFMKALLHYD